MQYGKCALPDSRSTDYGKCSASETNERLKDADSRTEGVTYACWIYAYGLVTLYVCLDFLFKFLVYASCLCYQCFHSVYFSEYRGLCFVCLSRS